jgi:hypothetical protein
VPASLVFNYRLIYLQAALTFELCYDLFFGACREHAVDNLVLVLELPHLIDFKDHLLSLL